jgi:hypothetical protein
MTGYHATWTGKISGFAFAGLPLTTLGKRKLAIHQIWKVRDSEAHDEDMASCLFHNCCLPSPMM